MDEKLLEKKDIENPEARDKDKDDQQSVYEELRREFGEGYCGILRFLGVLALVIVFGWCLFFAGIWILAQTLLLLRELCFTMPRLGLKLLWDVISGVPVP